MYDNDFGSLFDFPTSWFFLRGLCQQCGEPVPPNTDLPPYNVTEEEVEEAFIKWQHEQQERIFGYSSRKVSLKKLTPLARPQAVAPKPIQRYTPPAPRRLKGIDT